VFSLLVGQPFLPLYYPIFKNRPKGADAWLGPPEPGRVADSFSGGRFPLL